MQAGIAPVDSKTGKRSGPVLKTLVNREPRPARAVIQNWNGLDETGSYYIPDLPGFAMSVAATSLPENAILAVGNSTVTFLERARRRTGGVATDARALGPRPPSRSFCPRRCFAEAGRAPFECTTVDRPEMEGTGAGPARNALARGAVGGALCSSARIARDLRRRSRAPSCGPSGVGDVVRGAFGRSFRRRAHRCVRLGERVRPCRGDFTAHRSSGPEVPSYERTRRSP